MNDNIIISSMRRFILKYGRITEEYRRPRNVYYPKGSYYAHFLGTTPNCNMSMSVGDKTRFKVYSAIIKQIKRCVR